ncbi:MAG: restriction endonuclease subunit S [Saprospiraceae bacterium]|nr:restriction endonuclease subunit S [Saprospiraceae bacterium]HMS68454.1 restriction endonuclease subunit S [Saprospiraceae bacterium]
MRVLLQDIAEIQTGVFAKPNVDGDVVCLQANDFDENGNHLGFWTPTISGDNLHSKHFLNQGDVLFAAKGNKNFAAVRNHSLPLAVASTSFFVIRLYNTDILPEYLKWFLNHHDTLNILKSEAKGTAIPSISKKSLEQIEIPSIPLHKQNLILKIDQLRISQKVLLQKIASLRDQLIQRQLNKAINS